ncbi:hypothetical protein AGMMS49975_20000 [Clostridia bacterium]|nr:hypothetical protein AGMMS49975_20000 [Clostridia bacterium]
MDINSRILYLRSEVLNLTMEAFGQKIEMTRGAISSMEKGRRIVSERTIKIICSEFDVSELWLRDGIGEVFNNSDSDNGVKYLAQLYDSLSGKDKLLVDTLVDSLLEKYDKSRTHNKVNYFESETDKFQKALDTQRELGTTENIGLKKDA